MAPSARFASAVTSGGCHECGFGGEGRRRRAHLLAPNL